MGSVKGPIMAWSRSYSHIGHKGHGVVMGSIMRSVMGSVLRSVIGSVISHGVGHGVFVFHLQNFLLLHFKVCFCNSESVAKSFQMYSSFLFSPDFPV